MQDTSTLSDLIPQHVYDAQWRILQHSQRHHGSHLLAVQQLSRFPESSRKYVAGDPIHLIDWQAYARSDQLVIRQVREEASSRVQIAIDTSSPMRWPDREEVRNANKSNRIPQKIEVALRVGFNIAYTHIARGDRVDVWLMNDSESTSAKRLLVQRQTDLLSLFALLQEKQFDLDSLGEHLPIERANPSQVQVAYWVGDALSHCRFGDFLRLGRTRYLVHLLSSLEADIDWVDPSTFYFDVDDVNREFQGAELVTNQTYKESLNRWMTRIRQRVSALGGHYISITDQTPIAKYHALLAEWASGLAVRTSSGRI